MNLLQELTKVYETHGQLTPTLLVTLAADPNHPLHHRFEWDDTTAAAQWRLEQGAQLIRSVRITYTKDGDEPKDLRAFIATRGETAATGTYVPTADAVSDDFTRAMILRDMRRDWAVFERRYRHMAEFADLIVNATKEHAS